MIAAPPATVNQSGTVDIGMTGVSGVKSRKLWEVMDTTIVTNPAKIEFVVVTRAARSEIVAEGKHE